MQLTPDESDLDATPVSVLRDPRVQLVWTWVGLVTTPMFLVLFVMLALSLSPWCWLLVAGVLATVPFNIRDAIRYAGAFGS